MKNDIIAIINNTEYTDDQKAAAIAGVYARPNLMAHFDNGSDRTVHEYDYEWKHAGRNVLVCQQIENSMTSHLSVHIDCCFEYCLIGALSDAEHEAHKHLWYNHDLSEVPGFKEWINTLVDARLPAHIEWEAANA